ncbi:retrovirus-related pol polyprotein from transposon TNT 1-94 [Tanacetum coccineum]|uniref:Retrovirus-related pol polyprotein from transposon TNT 1-94 n=1 Tax=Tanacetum coccineum TaxID=301880 RepID=A0ABQ5FS68_9ASTR
MSLNISGNYQLLVNMFDTYKICRPSFKIPTSLPPQPIGEATKASNLQRIPPGVQGRSHFIYFLYLIVQIRILGKENGLQILQSIDQGPFELGTTRIHSELPLREVSFLDQKGLILMRISVTRRRNDTMQIKSNLGQPQMLLVVLKSQRRTENLVVDDFERFKMQSRQWGAQNRAGNANAGQGKPVKCYNCNGVGHIARNCTQPKRPQNSDYFKDKMLLMQAQENGAVLDEEELLFLADECDAFDSDVDNEPTAQTIFMANLSSVRSANPQAGPSNASILSEAKKAQPALYDGDELLKPHHVPVIVPSSEEELELAEATRNNCM